MVEGSQPPLPESALEPIRRVAEQRLTGAQHFATLARAVDLAIVLDDSALRRTVEATASDPAELVSRDIQTPESIEYVQRRAAEALSRP